MGVMSTRRLREPRQHGAKAALTHQLLPSRLCASMKISSSSADHSPLRTRGSRWLSQRSRHLARVERTPASERRRRRAQAGGLWRWIWPGYDTHCLLFRFSISEATMLRERAAGAGRSEAAPIGIGLCNVAATGAAVAGSVARGSRWAGRWSAQRALITPRTTIGSGASVARSQPARVRPRVNGARRAALKEKGAPARAQHLVGRSGGGSPPLDGADARLAVDQVPELLVLLLRPRADLVRHGWHPAPGNAGSSRGPREAETLVLSLRTE